MSTHRRLCFAFALAAAIAAPGPSRGDPPARPAWAHDDTLANLASHVGLAFGTAVDANALASEPAYAALLADQFSSVTPENAMKWGVVEPTRGTLDFSQADALVAFARAHGQLVRGHTLVWHNQLPGWLTAGSFTPDQLRDLLRKHILDEVSHFRGQIFQWDVVNEAFNEDGTLRDTIWLRALGPGYIADAFRWAHQADPRARLFYNDFNIEGLGPKSDAVFALVRQLRAEGVPIGGVGIQGHLATQFPFPSTMVQNLQRFAALGVDLAVTEADARLVLPASGQPTAEQLSAQSGTYDELVQACLAVARCVDFTVWGFTDEHSWVPGTFPGQGAADLYDASLKPKPAYGAVQLTLELAPGVPVRRSPLGAKVEDAEDQDR